jgi:hypothetical protein
VKSTPDGADVAHADKLSTPHLRMLMAEAENAPVSVSISWTQTAHERSASIRRDRLAVEAYCLAEARGFEPGHDAEEWLLAQAKIDATDARTFEG